MSKKFVENKSMFEFQEFERGNLNFDTRRRCKWVYLD